MRRWCGIVVLSTLALPACLGAQPARQFAVQAGGRVGTVAVEGFSGLTHGAATTLVWREPMPRLDVRAEWAVQRGGSVGDGCGLFAVACARVETRASVTMAALTLARRLNRNVYIRGVRRTHLFGGGALLAGHVTEDIGPTEAGCTFYFACVEAQPARTERHSIHRGALTGGLSVEARLRGIRWFGELRHTLASGAHAQTLTAGLLF